MSEQVYTYGTGILPRICVVGVGGAGGNAVANMMRGGVNGVDFIVANTDAQALNASPVQQSIQLGRKVTEGLGAGADAQTGRLAALESIDAIEAAIDGAHMCFIAAGMGGGTGTGAAPVIAAAARAKGILTVGVVTTPFGFEGRRRLASATRGIEELKAEVDTLIVIPNQNLFRVISPATTFREAFRLADEVLEQGVRSISDLIVMPGLINLDFADVRTVMLATGKAMLGTGEACGENRATDAAHRAIQNPLLDGAIKGARGLIISITGGEDMRLMEIDEAAMRIRDEVDPEANIIWGSAVDPLLEGRIRVSILATGIDADVAVPVRRPELAAVGTTKAPPQSPTAFVAEPATVDDAPLVAAAVPIPARAEPEPDAPVFVRAESPAAAPLPEYGDYEVQISAPWEDGYAATDTIVLTAPGQESLALASATLAQQSLLLAEPAPAAPEFHRYQPPARTRPVTRIDATRPLPERGPSLLQRLSMLARGDADRRGKRH
ncbi:cell division protein FtsZ [Allosphingosinicella deserti]|uniref:Cell division protein FtsZ n=1 Tax=Allosphingosinicella deserti TaxID=2116704 RepID=A0A2P7QVF1_9SPHN|nr:cell division protein FtsZ [Sphingomonas deserti]PSJ41939.1 cell division protein FtsZ [Sphingomonas deserti]